MNIYLLIFTIIFFGLLGGLVNAIRTKQEGKNYWKSLVKGLVAAFLVPVFLEIIKSQLGQNLSTNLYDYIVFGGLCLTAAIFSDKFIDTIGEKILEKAENAERRAEESNKKIDTIIDKKAEPEEDTEPVEKRILNFAEFKESTDTTNIQSIIKCLQSEKYEYRTVSGIAKDTGLSNISVMKILKDLQNKKIVMSVNSRKRTLWTLKK